MAALVIESLDEDVRLKLQELARDHGRSLADEAVNILRAAVVPQPDTGVNLGMRLADRFASCGLDQEILEFRGNLVQPPSFDRRSIAGRRSTH